MGDKLPNAFDESMRSTGLNSFDAIFLNFLNNPDSGFTCEEQNVHPDRSQGWLHDQLVRCEQTQSALSLREGSGEIRVELETHYEYPNADVYRVRSVYDKHASDKAEFLLVDKDPHALDATILSFKVPEAHISPVPGVQPVDASVKFL